MEEELRAKALASMSVFAKPKNNPSDLLNRKQSPDAKEDGELSSPSGGEEADDEEEETEKPQEMPTSTAATRSASVPARLRVEPSNMVAPKLNKLTQGSSMGKSLPPDGVSKRVVKQLPTTIALNQNKHLELNPVPSMSGSRHAPGWNATRSDANDNLVIRFSDDDSESDSEDQTKERTSERDITGIRDNRYKSSATSSQLKTKILQQRNIQIEKISNNVSSSRTFIPSANKIRGPSFRGSSSVPVQREPQIQRHVSLIRSSKNQDHGFVRGVNSTTTELESLRKQIARRENELKLQHKSMPQTKDIFPSSDGDCQGMKRGTRSAKMSRSASSDAVGLASKELERKRLKLGEHSYRQPSSDGQLQIPTNEKESSMELREQVLENNSCTKEHNAMAFSQCTKAISMPADALMNRTTSPAKVASSPEDGASHLLKVSSPTKSNDEMLKHPNTCGGINASNFFPNKATCEQNLIRQSEYGGNMSGDGMPPSTSGVIFNECPNHAPMSRLGTSDASAHDGSLLRYKGQLNAVEHMSSCIQSSVDIEEMYDKELEKAQDIRRRCELEERSALRAYRSAQRALLEANEKCNILYKKRELLSAQLRAFIMEGSSSLWSQRCDDGVETVLDSLNNVTQAKVDMRPSSSCRMQAYESNMQCKDGATVNVSYQNMNGHELGAEHCSEPDASTSELHHKDSSAPNGVFSPSNNLNVSADEDEEMFPLVHKAVQSSCNDEKEKLEEKIMNMSQESDRCSIENAHDSALLEASLRSKLLGMGTSLRSSGSCLNDEPFVGKGANNSIEKKTCISKGEPSVLSDLPFMDTEQAQMADTEGLGRAGSKNRQVAPHVHDQSHCDKFSSDYGYHQSTVPEESSSSFKEPLRPKCASFCTLPSSVMRIVFRHMKVIEPDSCNVFLSNKATEDNGHGLLQKNAVNISSDDNQRGALKAHASSNCMRGTRTGTLESSGLAIDPFWPHCMFELRGKCNNEECTWQHVRDYSKKNTTLLNDSAVSEDQANPSLAFGKLTDGSCIQPSPHHHIMPVPTYRLGTNLMKVDSHSCGCIFARTICQYWQWDFCTSFAVPLSIQRILPSDIPSLHAGDGSIKDHDCWNSLSLYFHNPASTMEQDKQGSATVEQTLELALDLFFNGNANKQEGKKKALIVLSQALGINRTSIVLWIVYLHIYYRKEKAIGKNDIFHLAIQQNEGSYELWLMYINSRMQNGDRLDAYHSALLTFCRLASSINKECIHASACILDLFLQMVDFLCMFGDVGKIISRIYEFLSPVMDFNDPGQILLSDILKCLTISDKCNFWVCCVYLMIYKKLPQSVVERLEFKQQLLFELDWPSAQLKADEKHQALELMKIAVEMVTGETNGYSYERDHSNKTALRSAHSLVINHVKCVAAMEGIESAENLLAGYMKLYPTCVELVLTSARWQKDNLGDEMGFDRFEEALRCWPKEDPGVHCLWNQYVEFALENGSVTLAKKLMLRWFESVWKDQDPESRKVDGGKNALCSNPKGELFGLLNLSLHRLLQSDKVGARLSIDRALKLAAPEDLKYIVREYALFILSGGADLVKDTPASEIRGLFLSYLSDVRLFPVSEPLSRSFLKIIKKPRTQQLVNRLLGPVSLDCSLMNAILKDLYGPSLLPEHFGKITVLVDFVEALMEILPANYHLAMSVCKLMVRTTNLDGVTSATVMFWAGTILVNSIIQAFPVAPEWIWLEAADVLGDLGMWDVSYRFHQLSVSVYPFSVKLWRTYCNSAKKNGNTNAIIDAARERGIKLD